MVVNKGYLWKDGTVMDRFIRNNYYDGKHLSTDCFNAEQAYNSAKQAQISKLIFGKGVICGFNVAQFYPDTIKIDSGIAINDDGQIIAMDDAVLLPVAAIDGFEMSLKKYTLRAFYKETREGRDIIAEQCAFTYNNDQKGVELAHIILKHGKIDSITDTRKSVDSQFFKNLVEKSILVLESQLGNKTKDIFYRYLPDFVKHVVEASDTRIRQIIDGQLLIISNKVKNLEEQLKEAEKTSKSVVIIKRGKRGRHLHRKRGEKQ